MKRARIPKFLGKKIFLCALGALILILLLSYTATKTIRVSGVSRQNKSLLFGKAKSPSPNNTNAGDSQFSSGIDFTDQIFLDKKPKNSKEGKNIIRYVNEANDAITLTPDALRFALAELILGSYEPLKDAQLRLDEGRLALEKITPPADALVFHQMSLKLLQEYSKILLVPLNTPRADFKPAQYGDSFGRLSLLVGLAKRELRFLQNTYSISLFPKSILFYDEAIWIK